MRRRTYMLAAILGAALLAAVGVGPPAEADEARVSSGAGAESNPLTVSGRSASSSFHLLDRGQAPDPAGPDGGTPPPTGPITIAYAGGSPGAVAAGAPAAGAFPSAGLGGFFGHLFTPVPPATVGYPATFLTAGSTSGYLVTGAYAWHSPFTAGGGPGGSPVRILVAAAAGIPATPFAPVATGGFGIFTASAGPPGPAGVVGGPGIFPGVRIGGTAAPASAAFCGLAVGGPMFTPGWAGNGLGASLPAIPAPPLRVGFFPPFFATGAAISAVPAPPQNFIAGCFADSSTTPVELMAFGVE